MATTQAVNGKELVEAIKLIMSWVEGDILVTLQNKGLHFEWEDGYLKLHGTETIAKEVAKTTQVSVLSFIPTLKVPSATSTFEITADKHGLSFLLGTFSKTVEASDPIS